MVPTEFTSVIWSVSYSRSLCHDCFIPPSLPERKEPEERRSSSKKDEVLEDDKPSSDVAKPGPVETEAPASTLGLALLARVNGAAQDELHSEGDTQSN